MAEQAARLSYAHGSAFTTEPLEAYAAARSAATCRSTARRSTRSRAGRRRSRRPSSWPAPTTSPNGEPDREIVIGRWGELPRQHPRRARPVGRRPLRRPYEPWLGRFRHVSAAYPYRAATPGQPRARATAPSSRPSWTRRSSRPGPGPSRRSSPSRSSGATLAAAVPPDGLLAADRRGLRAPRRAAHRRRGHDRLRPDGPLVRQLTTGASSRTCSSRPRARRRATGRSGSSRRRTRSTPTVTGPAASSTGSRTRTSRSAAAVAREVLRILEAEDLVAASATKGVRLRELVAEALGRPPGGRRRPRPRPPGRRGARRRPDDPRAVPARRARSPRPSSAPRASAASSSTRAPATPTASNGDTILLGPPFVVTDDELRRIASVLAEGHRCARRARPRSPRPAAGRPPQAEGGASTTRRRRRRAGLRRRPPPDRAARPAPGSVRRRRHAACGGRPHPIDVGQHRRADRQPEEPGDRRDDQVSRDAAGERERRDADDQCREERDRAEEEPDDEAQNEEDDEDPDPDAGRQLGAPGEATPKRRGPRQGSPGSRATTGPPARSTATVRTSPTRPRMRQDAAWVRSEAGSPTRTTPGERQRRAEQDPGPTPTMTAGTINARRASPRPDRPRRPTAAAHRPPPGRRSHRGRGR